MPDYASALDCNAKGVAFATGGNAEWAIQTSKASVGASALVSGAIGGNDSTSATACKSWVEATFVGAGTLEFQWAVSCDDGYEGTLYAWAECTLNGEAAKGTDKIYGTKDASWRSVTLTLPEGTNTVRWTYAKIENAYNKSSGNAGEDCAWLDGLVWTPDTPPEYSFTVNWGEGVLGARYSIEGGVQNADAENGVAISVPDGMTISVEGLADSNNWYVVSGGTGTFDAEGSTTITAQKRSPSDSATAAEVGLTGAFANADTNEVAKVMEWAQENGKTVSDINAMTFSASGDPLDDDAKAYLLDCAPEDVEDEAANFKVTSFSVDAEGNIVITPSDGSVYGNGSVEVRYSATIGGEYTTVKPAGGQCFIKLYLVK